jgi:hypothetical protein
VASVADPLNSSPALGDVNGDGQLDIVVGGGYGSLYVLDAQGHALPGFDTGGNGYLQVGANVKDTRMGSPILADLDGKTDIGGKKLPEIIIGSNEGKVYAFRGDGTPLRGFPYAVPGAKVGVGLAAWDVDKDGTQDLVIQCDKVQKISILNFPDCHFDPTEDGFQEANPWTQFRHDAWGTGYIDNPIVYNPVETVSLLSESASPLTVDLRWRTTADWRSFEIQRKLEPDGDWQSLGEWAANEIQESPSSYHAIDRVPGAGVYGYRLGGRDATGDETWIGETSVSVGGAALRFQLHPANPNPFRPATTVRLDLPVSGPCDVRVLDASGRTVRVLHHGTGGPGPVTMIWNGQDDAGHDMGSGIYFIRAEAEKQGHSTEKVVRLR